MKNLKDIFKTFIRILYIKLKISVENDLGSDVSNYNNYLYCISTW